MKLIRSVFPFVYLALSVVVLVLAVSLNAATRRATSVDSPFIKVETANGHGSGVYLGDRRILTAAHVVKGEASVSVNVGGAPRAATVVWIDKDYDVALLRVSDGSGFGQRAALSCALVAVGVPVIAHGNPMNVDDVATYGRVSGAPRVYAPWKSVFVTDITTVPGMSGGALVDSQRRVVGLVVGVLTMPLPTGLSATGIGFAVPGPVLCDLMRTRR